jgi:hypothetical protein
LGARLGGTAAASDWIEEQPENKDRQKQGQKTQAVNQMGAVEWKQKCPEDKEGSTQQTKAKTAD